MFLIRIISAIVNFLIGLIVFVLQHPKLLIAIVILGFLAGAGLESLLDHGGFTLYWLAHHP